MKNQIAMDAFQGLPYKKREAGADVEMLYVEKESVTCIVEDRDRLLIREGDLILLGAETVFEILKSPTTARGFSLSLPAESMKSAVLPLGQPGAYMQLSVGDKKAILNLLENLMLLKEKEREPAFFGLISQTVDLLLLHVSLQEESIKNKSSRTEEDKVTEEMLAYIDTYFPKGSLEELADMLSYPPYYLSRLIKKRTGKNFKALIMDRKLAHAAYLLTHTSLPIDAIIESIGYANSSFFFNVFKKKYGSSPRQYRLAHR